MKKLPFKTRINLGFAAMFIIILSTTFFSVWQLNSMSKNLELVYEHPYKVSNAIREVQIEILRTTHLLEYLRFVKHQKQLDHFIDEIIKSDSLIRDDIYLIKVRYLGNQKDVDSLLTDYSDWESIKKTSYYFIKNNQIDSLDKILSYENQKQIDKILNHINVISNFAANKAKIVKNNAIKQKEQFLSVIIFTILIICLIVIFLSYIISKNITRPIKKFIQKANTFFSDKSLNSEIKFYTEEQLFDYTLNELEKSYQNIEQQNEEIRSNNEQLAYFNKNLEEKIEERTKKLQENESFLKETQMIANLGTYTLDITTGKWTCSEILNNIFGIDPDFEKTIQTWVSIIHHDWQKIMNDYFENEVIGQKKKFDKEYKIVRRRDNKVRWVRGIGTLKFNENEEPVLMIGTIFDITERKHYELKLKEMNEEITVQNEEYRQLNLELQTSKEKAEKSEYELHIKNKDYEAVNEELHQTNDELSSSKEKIEESELKYRLLYSTMNQGLALHEIILDSEGKPTDYIFLDINDSYTKILGITREVSIGRRIREVMPEVEQYWIDIFGKVALTGEPIYYENYLKTTGKYYSTYTYCPKKHQFAVLVNDITERKEHELELKEKNEKIEAQNLEYRELNQELQVAKEKAEESNNLKTAFLQNISHEVRTPLNSIVGFSQLMVSQNRPPEKLKRFADLISTNSNKLIDIITDIIEISQIQAKLLKSEMSEFDIIPFIRNISSNYIEKAKEKNIELILKINITNKEFIISSDREKLQKTIIHLVDNALKFTKNGKVEIICDIIDNNLQISISDTGIGISLQMQNVIFDSFRQVDSQTSRLYGGNGLGLSIAKAYTELLSGSISLKSEINVGSIFTVSIPIIKPEVQENQKKITIQNSSIDTILIAEDEYSNYVYLRELVDETKFTIIYAKNGKEALDLCKTNYKIGLILMDIKMPILDGHEATKLIKAFRPDLPIIAITAFALETEKLIYLNDFDDYITKPINEIEFKQKLIKYIEL